MKENLVKELDFTVASYETGANYTIKYNALMNYIQEAGSQHAADLGFGYDVLMEKGVFWVLARIYIDLDETIKWQDNITIKTWPRGHDKYYAFREYEIYKDGKKIGSACSVWLIVNFEKRQICRPSEYIQGFPDEAGNTSFEKIPRAIKRQKDFDSTYPFKALYSKLDYNKHVNNAEYSNIIVDALSDILNENFVIKKIQIDYLHEIRLNEEIDIKVKKLENNQYLVSGFSEEEEQFKFRSVVDLVKVEKV